MYLFPGTYTANGTITIPNGTTLYGAGRETSVIKLDIGSGTDNLIETAGTFTIRDLGLDDSLATGGTQQGIYVTGGGIVQSLVTNVYLGGWTNGDAIKLSNAAYVDGITDSVIEGNVSLIGTGASNSTVVKSFANNLVFGSFSLLSSSGGNSAVYNMTNNAIPGTTTIDGAGTSASFISGNTLNDVAITNGAAVSNFVNNATSDLTLSDVTNTTVSDNTFANAGTDAISLTNADNIKIANNTITNNGGSGYGISIDAASDGTYLNDNTLGGYAINDLGTNTTYGGQVDGSNNYVIQPAGGAINLNGNSNVTGNLTVTGTGSFTGGSLTVATTTSTDDRIITSVTTGGVARFDGTITNQDLTAARTWTLQDNSGVIALGTAGNSLFFTTTGATNVTLPTSGTLCSTTSCGTAGSGYVQFAPGSVQTDGTNNNSIFINKTSGTGNILELQKGGSDVFAIDNTGNATFTGNVTVAAGKTLRITGGNTASHAAAPTSAGQLYFDTDTNQLLTSIYNSDTAAYQWKASSQEAILVAANNSSVADKQAADYVADGTGDQTEINYALAKGAGKRVVLLPGTYVANGTILVPDNTVLAGTNRNATIIQLSVGGGTDNLIENATSSHANITIQDLMLDGSLGTAGTQQGIYLHDGDITNRSSLKNLKMSGWTHGNSVALNNSYLDVFTGSSLGGLSVAGTQIKSFANNQAGDIAISAASAVNTFSGNTFSNITFDGANIDSFTGNSLSNITLSNSANITSVSGNSIFGTLTISGSSSLTNVTGNNIGGGITASGSTTIGLLSANAMGRLSLTNSSVITISGNNIIYAGTDNGIKLVNTDSSKISGNRIVRISGSAAAISIDAATDGTYLSDNNIGTASIIDSGTNTVYGGQNNGTSYLLQPNDDFALTGNAASTVSTTAGDLTLQGGSGEVSLGTSTKLKANGALNITSGGANALGLDTGGGAAINIGGTNATSIVLGRAGGGTVRVGQNGGTVQIDGTNFDVGTNGLVTLTGGLAGGDILTQSTNALGIDTGGAAAINLGATNATSIVLGRAGGGTVRVGQNGGTVQIDGTNFDVGTNGLVTLTGGLAGGDVLTQGTNALGLDTGGGAAINIGATNATSIVIGKGSGQTVRLGQNGGTVQIDGTNFDVATTGRMTLLGGVAGGDILTQSTNALGIDTGGAAAINIGATNANAINIGRASGGGAVTITGNAASTWKTTTGDLSIQGGTNLNLNTVGAGTVNLGQTNTGIVNIGGNAATTAIVLQTAASSGNGVVVQSSSATAFRVQNSGAGFTLFTADATATKRVTIGTTATPNGLTSSNGDLMVVGNAEVQGTLYFGNSGSNAIYTASAGGPLRFKGTARNSITTALIPEYAGAVITGDGSDNIGTMTADFCSGSSYLNIPTSSNPCGASEEHNYYSWTTSQVTAQDYDIYVRWQVPSNYDSSDAMPAINFYGWRTSTTNDAITMTVRNGSTTCGTATSAGGSNGAWTQATYTTGSCGTITPGSTVLTFKLRLSAATNDTVRVGEIGVTYNALF